VYHEDTKVTTHHEIHFNVSSWLRGFVKIRPSDQLRRRHENRSSQTSGRWAWRSVAAAAVLVVATLVGITVRNAPHGEPVVMPDVADDMGGFMPWPGAAAGPPFESGQMVRVDLPVSVLPALGLWPPVSDVTFVQADVIVGQDGFARAVRLAR